jgi:hypothetical protein
MSGLLKADRVPVEDRITGQKGLGRAARNTARALAEALFTTGEGPPPAERLDWLVEDLDDLIGRVGTRGKLVFRLCLFAVSTIAPLLAFRLLPFRFLSSETRMRALERMERSPFGLAVFAAKALLCIVYYEHPDSARMIGYDGTCLTGPHAPELGDDG